MENSKTDLESKLQAAIFMIRYLNNDLKESKKEMNSLKDVMDSASRVLSECDDTCYCGVCNKWYVINQNNFYFCNNDDCSFRSCDKCFNGIICETEQAYCLDCIEGRTNKCNICEKYSDIYDKRFYFCCNDTCSFKSCEKCFNGIKCYGGLMFCLYCIEKYAEKCDSCGVWHDYVYDYDNFITFCECCNDSKFCLNCSKDNTKIIDGCIFCIKCFDEQ